MNGLVLRKFKFEIETMIF